MTARLALLALVALGGEAAAAPRLEPVASAGRVVVVAEPGEGLGDVAERLADRAEATLARIATDLPNLPAPGHIEIRLVRDAADLARIAPEGRGAPVWAVGVAYPELSIVSVATSRDGMWVDAEQTLRHELGHIALGVALGDRAPHWLHEGFAYQHSAEWSMARTETLAGLAWFGNIVPLAELDRSFPEEEAPAHRAYAESYDFVGFLSRRGRWEDDGDRGNRQPFRRFLVEIGHGATPDDAATHAFGRPLRWLFEEWKDDLRSRYKFLPLGLLGLAVWILCSLLLVVAWWRRKRQNKRRIAQWDVEDAERQARLQPEPPPTGPTPSGGTRVIAPPYVPWPGEDPFDIDPDDEPKRGRLLN